METKSLKILQIISYFHPAVSYGGPGKLTYELSTELARLGHNVSVVSTDAWDKNRRRKTSDNKSIDLSRLKVKFFKNLDNRLAYNQKIFTPFQTFGYLILNVRKFDVIHLHEFFTFPALWAAVLARYFKIPYLISAHGTLDDFHLKHRSGLKKMFMVVYGKSMIDYASGFVSATDEETGEYRKLGVAREKVFQVKNGIDIKQFYKLPQRGIFRKSLNISAEKVMFLYLGRISNLKGLEELIDAFDRQQGRGDYDSVLIIGGSDDGYLNYLMDKVQKLKMEGKVFFPGILTGKRKLSALRDTDVFIYPSPAEGFSLAVLEAAASGLPLIITTGCKFPEVGQSKSGIISDGTPSDLSVQMDILSKNSALRREMSLNAKKLAVENYSITNMAKRLVGVYNKFLKKIW